MSADLEHFAGFVADLTTVMRERERQLRSSYGLTSASAVLEFKRGESDVWVEMSLHLAVSPERAMEWRLYVRPREGMWKVQGQVLLTSDKGSETAYTIDYRDNPDPAQMAVMAFEAFDKLWAVQPQPLS